MGLDPTLILAVMAIESSFNPFAQSSVGAQGLMQAMTRLHDHKYQPYVGVRAALGPVTNLRAGVQVHVPPLTPRRERELARGRVEVRRLGALAQLNVKSYI